MQFCKPLFKENFRGLVEQFDDSKKTTKKKKLRCAMCKIDFKTHDELLNHFEKDGGHKTKE